MPVPSNSVRGSTPSLRQETPQSFPQCTVLRQSSKYHAGVEYFKLEPGGKKRLIQCWNSLLKSQQVDPDEHFSILDDLLTRHSEPQRVYHNLSHIAHLLDRLEGHLPQSSLEFALWFHDSVYDPTRPDNEEQSAALARARLSQMGLPPGLVSEVEALILATKTHQAFDATSALLLDADLAILGAKERVYEAYSRAIGAEYAWLPEEAYRQGRAGVLTSFLERPQIYQTEGFKALEEPARENLARELERLK